MPKKALVVFRHRSNTSRPDAIAYEQGECVRLDRNTIRPKDEEFADPCVRSTHQVYGARLWHFTHNHCSAQARRKVRFWGVNRYKSKLQPPSLSEYNTSEGCDLIYIREYLFRSNRQAKLQRYFYGFHFRVKSHWRYRIKSECEVLLD